MVGWKAYTIIGAQPGCPSPTLTCVGLGGCRSKGEPRKNGRTFGWKARGNTGPDARFAPAIATRLAGGVAAETGRRDKTEDQPIAGMPACHRC